MSVGASAMTWSADGGRVAAPWNLLTNGRAPLISRRRPGAATARAVLELSDEFRTVLSFGCNTVGASIQTAHLCLGEATTRPLTILNSRRR